MAPKVHRMSYSEIYGRAATRADKPSCTALAAQPAPAGAPAARAAARRPGQRSRPGQQSLLPFGYSLTERSKSQLQKRCLLLAALFVPLLAWHFGVPALFGDYGAATGVLATADVDVNAAAERRLVSDEDPERRYNCLTEAEYQDHQEISFVMVRKYHLTMGGKQGDPSNKCLSKEGPCLQSGYLLFLYIPSLFYMFIAIAIVCDEFFVPSLEMFVDHYGISMDIAGATFMAAGGSMPELATSFIAVLDESDVGFAAIVGSAVFNVLFVIAVCALASKEALELTAWPLARDCTFYLIGLGLVAAFFMGPSPNEIEWWEALFLFIWYLCYCGFMTVNEKVKGWCTKRCSKRAVSPEEDVKGGEVPENDTEGPRKGSKEAFSRQGSAVNLKMPSKFRSGIVKLLTQYAALTETAGIAVVTELKGTIKDAFDRMDKDSDGEINETEFSEFMRDLGWHPPANDNEVRDVTEKDTEEQPSSKLWKRMPLTDNETLKFEDFRKWYTVSSARIAIEVRKVFERLDRNGDGVLDKDEISQLLLLLGHRPTDKELGEVVNEIMRLSSDDPENTPGDSGEKVAVKFAQFDKWYSQSMFCEAHHRYHQMEEDEEVGFSIDWPKDPDGKDVSRCTWQLFWYIFTYPLCAAMYCTLPDVRRSGMDGKIKWAIIEFLLSLLWIIIFSNALYECTVVCSNTIGIWPPVAAVTILAAGTSVPDLLSSYVVAKQGEGDMAVSSSIGSNIFDITVGLPIPWMFYSMVNQGNSVKVGTQSLMFSLLLLIAMLAAVVLTVMIMKWKMTKCLGGVMFAFYIIFLVQEMLQNFPTKENPVFKPF